MKHESGLLYYQNGDHWQEAKDQSVFPIRQDGRCRYHNSEVPTGGEARIAWFRTHCPGLTWAWGEDIEKEAISE